MDGKNPILKIITDIGMKEVNYKIFEFHGNVQNIPTYDRLTISTWPSRPVVR